MNRRAVPLIAGILFVTACAGESETTPSVDVGNCVVNEATTGELRIVSTVAPITSIVGQIVGDTGVVVTGLVPEGTNSHTFEPPPSAAQVLGEADAVFMNGLILEEPTKDLAQANAKDGAVLCELGSETITEDEWIFDFSFPESGGKPNPHLWTNPPFALRYGEIILEVLSNLSPDNASQFEANFDDFASSVVALDEAMVKATATLDPEQRKLVTYHDAYAYFAKHYEWTVIGAIQPSSFEDPTPRDIAELIEQVKAENVAAIFGSEVFPSPVLEQIGNEADVTYVDVLRDDDLPGDPGAAEHSWLGLMRFNFVTMVEALGGDASALEAVELSTHIDNAEYPQ